MHLYHERYGSFPPAAVTNSGGRPLCSWRVLLLPHLAEENLYKQFHLDEPWDSPHNLTLLPRMPEVYAAPARADAGAPRHATFYQVFVGLGAVFDNTQRVSLSDVTDRSLTCLVTEAGRPVLWSKPEDLPYAVEQPLPELAGIFRGGTRFSGLAKQNGFNVAFVDGSIRWMRRICTDEEEIQFRSLILRKEKKTEPDLLY